MTALANKNPRADFYAPAVYTDFPDFREGSNADIVAP